MMDFNAIWVLNFSGRKEELLIGAGANCSGTKKVMLGGSDT
jgi:hypothetical protein